MPGESALLPVRAPGAGAWPPGVHTISSPAGALQTTTMAMASRSFPMLRTALRPAPALLPRAQRVAMSTSAVQRVAPSSARPDAHAPHSSGHGDHGAHGGSGKTAEEENEEVPIAPAELNKPWFWSKVLPVAAVILYAHLVDPRLPEDSYFRVKSIPGRVQTVVEAITPSFEEDRKAHLDQYAEVKERADYALFLQTIENPKKHVNMYP